MIEKAKNYVRELLGKDTSGHDAFHTFRVLALAETICAREQKNHPVDLEMLQLIALLHDVDDRKLSPDTWEHQTRARIFLEENHVAEEKIAGILRGISQISYKGTDSVSPDTIEAKCVQDADRLDAMGAMGIARAFAFGGSRGRAMYDPGQMPRLSMDGEAYAKNEGHTINHFYEKLLLLKDMMNTETGRKMAEHRHGVMLEFLEEFYGEWEGAI